METGEKLVGSFLSARSQTLSFGNIFMGLRLGYLLKTSFLCSVKP